MEGLQIKVLSALKSFTERRFSHERGSLDFVSLFSFEFGALRSYLESFEQLTVLNCAVKPASDVRWIESTQMMMWSILSTVRK